MSPQASATPPCASVPSPTSGATAGSGNATRPPRTTPHFAAARKPASSGAATRSHAVGSRTSAPVMTSNPAYATRSESLSTWRTAWRRGETFTITAAASAHTRNGDRSAA